jgi:uncharacterized protein
MEDSDSLSEETINIGLELANKGYAEAQNMLGHHYILTEDYDKAIYWLYEAGKQDYFESIYALAVLFKTGKGVEKDIKTSYELLKKAADGGYVQAQELLREWEESARGYDPGK